MSYVRVAVDVPLPTLFDYRCEGADPGLIGALVQVPFGRKQTVGVVLETSQRAAVAAPRIRPLTRVLENIPRLPADILELLRFVSEYYHFPIGEVVHAALPGGLRTLRRRAADTPDARPDPAVREEPRPVLTHEQEAAVEQISQSLGRFQPWLLHGVTGSGKTEVYLRVMEQALHAGGQVLLLVPEIGLTPQLDARIRARFAGFPLVSLHSALSSGTRARNWLAAQSGTASIVLGTRSAIFAPLPLLALVVVDEEHDSSFKQIEAMRYSARDLAVWRARQRAVPVILGSATPALESYRSALQGRYAHLQLTRRANRQALPRVELVPIAALRLREGFAPRVLEAIGERIGAGEQVLVYLNRRGYAPVLLCAACGWAASCHRCSARLVLHKLKGRLLCHHCGHEEAIAAACGECGNIDLRPLGQGTQRLEAALAAAFPGARVLRIDRDTTRGRSSLPDMLRSIANREVDVLVGTQLLSKGHDFPGIGLVCVLDADRSLYSTDFRASEQLFAQLVQVAGRAGRGVAAGDVLIQTAFPRHALYQAVRQLDFDAFAKALLAERSHAKFPPFVYQAVLRAEATRLAGALDFLHGALKLALPHAEGITVFDPAPAVMVKLKGRSRAQLLVQSASRSKLQRFLSRWTQALHGTRSTVARWAIDVDPLDV